MKFYLDSKNPYRNFVKNITKIHDLNISDEERSILYASLYKKLMNKFDEKFLASHPSFKFFQNEDKNDKLRNPYKTFQTQFEYGLKHLHETKFHTRFCNFISMELGFLRLVPRAGDWLYDS